MKALNREYAPTRDRLAMRGDERSSTPRTSLNQGRKDLPENKKRTWTVYWTETYLMRAIPGESEQEVIETAKSKLCSQEDEGESIDTLDFFAKEEYTLQQQQANFSKDTAQLRKALKGFTQGW